jgi:hypothetical protein
MNSGGRAMVRLKCRCRTEVVNPTGGEERLPTLSSGLDFVSSSPQGAGLRPDGGVKTWPETQGLEDGVNRVVTVSTWGPEIVRGSFVHSQSSGKSVRI